MSKRHYRLSKQAVNDLESIWVFTEKNWSVVQADRYYGLIIDEIQHVAANLGSGRSFDHIRKGYWATKVGSHLIYYRRDADGLVEIIRILHERMDLKRRME